MGIPLTNGVDYHWLTWQYNVPSVTRYVGVGHGSALANAASKYYVSSTWLTLSSTPLAFILYDGAVAKIDTTPGAGTAHYVGRSGTQFEVGNLFRPTSDFSLTKIAIESGAATYGTQPMDGFDVQIRTGTTIGGGTLLGTGRVDVLSASTTHEILFLTTYTQECRGRSQVSNAWAGESSGRSAVLNSHAQEARGLSRVGYSSYSATARGRHALLNSFSVTARGLSRVGYESFAQECRGAHVIYNPFDATARGIAAIQNAHTSEARGLSSVLNSHTTEARGLSRYGEWIEYTQSITEHFRIADDSLARYELYEGVDVNPDFTGSAIATSQTLPFSSTITPGVTDETHKYTVLERNEYNIASLNQSSTDFVLDSSGDVVLSVPSSPVSVSLIDGINGTVVINASYYYTDDGTSKADEWLIYLRSNGTDPVPGVDTPLTQDIRTSNGFSYLNYGISGVSGGSDARLILRVNRESDSVTDGNTTVYQLTTAATPSTPTGTAFGGRTYEAR